MHNLDFLSKKYSIVPLKKQKGGKKMYIVNLIFSDGPTNSIVKDFCIPLTPEREKSLNRVLQIMSLIWRLEYRFDEEIHCSFRENDGILDNPEISDPDFPFVIYVSKSDRNEVICHYEISFHSEKNCISIRNESIYASNLGYDEALEMIATDVSDELIRY